MLLLSRICRQTRRADRKVNKNKAKAPVTTPTPATSAHITTQTQPKGGNRGSINKPTTKGNPLGSAGIGPQRVGGGEKGRVCGRCDEALVRGGVVKALDKEWHRDCFTCNGCQGDLSKGFLNHEGQPYCAGCHGKAAGLPNCLGCHETVSGAYLSLGDKGSALNWHKSCFNCNRCSTSLGDATNFQVQDAKPICGPCYAK